MIDLDNLTNDELMDIILLANKIRKNPNEYTEVCKGKILATLFYEPSTRTQMSFQTAMLRLGGQIIGFDNPQNSSVSKGENLKDTVRIVGGYADIIAIRHPNEGTAMATSLYSPSPIINAGDGGHLHPTQTLTDVVTLYNEKGRLNNLCIGLCGDLLNGRTVHSLIKTMSHFENNKFVLISTKELSLPQYMKDILKGTGSNCTFIEIPTLQDAIPMLDVLYMTRIQRERFVSEEEYKKQLGIYVLDTEKMKYAKKDLKVLHPLPRIDEITVDVDDDDRAVYFEQTVYGMYARMALIMTMLKNNKKEIPKTLKSTHRESCSNPKCITNKESYIPKLFIEAGDMLVCRYCEHRKLIDY